MQDLFPFPPESSPFLIERGEDPSVLIIAFSGFAGELMMPNFEFFQLSRSLRYSRILLRDLSQTCYWGGIPPVADGLESLVAMLRDAIGRLSPDKIMMVGTSAGATGALLAGHALQADYVHAFSPFTYAEREVIEKNNDLELFDKYGEVLEKVWALPPAVHRFFDLRKVLMAGNGKTRYYLHVCRQRPWDVFRSKYLLGCPNLSVFGYPCSTHGVTRSLVRLKLLDRILQIENQDNLTENIRAWTSKQRAASRGDADGTNTPIIS